MITVFLKSTVRPARIGQASIIENLQQDVEHIRMRLLNLVKQDRAVGPAPHGFRKLSAFVIANVSRRRANQPRYRMLLHVFGHVDPNHGMLVVKQKFRQRPCQFRFSHAGGPQEDERANRFIGIAQARARTPYRIGNPLQRIVLAHHTLAQTVFHAHQLADLAFQHLGDRYAGPLGDDPRHVFLIHFFFEHAALFVICLRLSFGQFRFRLAQVAIADCRHALQVAAALRLLLFNLQLLNPLFELADARDSLPSLASSATFSALECSRMLASSRSTTASRSRELASSSFFSACFSISKLRRAPLQAGRSPSAWSQSVCAAKTRLHRSNQLPCPAESDR